MAGCLPRLRVTHFTLNDQPVASVARCPARLTVLKHFGAIAKRFVFDQPDLTNIRAGRVMPGGPEAMRRRPILILFFDRLFRPRGDFLFMVNKSRMGVLIIEFSVLQIDKPNGHGLLP
jgi:hypothetical protein